MARRYASRIFAACRSPVCIQHATSAINTTHACHILPLALPVAFAIGAGVSLHAPVHDEKRMTMPRYTKSSEYCARETERNEKRQPESLSLAT
jgi:hypothetical protein